MMIFRKKPIECNYSEKLIFLINQTLEWFKKYYKEKTKDSVDFHPELYALRSTRIAIDRVVAQKRVNECFTKCVSELKENGNVKELIAYGII